MLVCRDGAVQLRCLTLKLWHTERGEISCRVAPLTHLETLFIRDACSGVSADEVLPIMTSAPYVLKTLELLYAEISTDALAATSRSQIWVVQDQVW